MPFSNQPRNSRRRWGPRQFTLITSILIVALLSLVVPPVLRASAAAKTVNSSADVGSVTPGAIKMVRQVNLSTLSSQPVTASGHFSSPPFRYPYASPQEYAARIAAAAVTPDAPRVQSSPEIQSPGIVVNFKGVTAVDSASVNGGDVEPPDQGLCVGPGSSGSGAELEAVNDALKIYSSTGGTLKGTTSLTTFFSDLDSLTDPRCFYDPTVHTWFFVVLAFSSSESHLDLAVNPTTNPLSTWTIYNLDTTDSSHSGCPCLGDQPLLGVDAHGVFLSTNEFDLATGTKSNGAQVYAIDKVALVALANPVYDVHYSNLTSAGVMSASVEPALTTSTSPAEYFLNSLDPSGTTDTRLGVWAMTNDVVLHSSGIPTFSEIVITSQKYGLPPAAKQKGTTKLLQSDDDRMLQVQNVAGTLWSSLITVVRPSGDTANRAGAAWFQIVPKLDTSKPPKISSATITAQGIEAVSGKYLLYPAIAVNDIKDAAMIVSYTGSTIYPSVAYATGSTFSTLVVATSGSTFDNGFTCSPCRWGDYSAAVWSSIPSGTRKPNLWFATAYVADTGDGVSNWSTRVLEVVPAGG